jgi:hypothetical protein
MREIAYAVGALLAFLVPIGVYCFLLAAINRRSKPLIVSGIWDTVGLLSALSGFFLVTVPMLFAEVWQRVAGVGLGEEAVEFLVWSIYFLIVIGGAATMLFGRSNRTSIYNVDPDLFTTAFEQAAARVGLAIAHEDDCLVLRDAQPAASAETGITELPIVPTGVAGANRRRVEVHVDAFRSMCHVTLHWDRVTPGLRKQLELEIEKGLELAAPEDNPAAGWFFSISGLVFGALFVIALACVLAIIFPRR